MTRREQQARTRAQIVAAARKVFMAHGYHRASLAEVVREAGFTKGAVYSNFSSKAELALAVLAEIEQANVARLGELLQQDSDPAQRARVLNAWSEELLRDMATIRLRAEVNLDALGDPRLAEVLAAKSRGTTAAVTAMLRDMPDAHRFPLDVEVVAEAMLALSNGIGMQRLIDPAFPIRAFILGAGVLTGQDVPHGARTIDADGSTT